jgi:hypothetical protein
MQLSLHTINVGLGHGRGAPCGGLRVRLLVQCKCGNETRPVVRLCSLASAGYLTRQGQV